MTLRVASDSLGERLIAAYAMGSLARGGFSPLVGEPERLPDVGLILTDPIQESDADSDVALPRTCAPWDRQYTGGCPYSGAQQEIFAGRAMGGQFSSA